MTDPKTTELIEVLEALTILLRKNDAEHWAGWMEQASGRLKNSDYSGVEKVLGAYGGMGSFNDLVLVAEPQVNDQLNILREQAWQLATEIKRNYRIAQ